jgi:hypothetical protein
MVLKKKKKSDDPGGEARSKGFIFIAWRQEQTPVQSIGISVTGTVYRRAWDTLEFGSNSEKNMSFWKTFQKSSSKESSSRGQVKIFESALMTGRVPDGSPFNAGGC